jgi:hypothetical protein
MNILQKLNEQEKNFVQSIVMNNRFFDNRKREKTSLLEKIDIEKNKPISDTESQFLKSVLSLLCQSDDKKEQKISKEILKKLDCINANKLNDFLTKHNISQYRFAKITGYPQSSVNAYSTGVIRTPKSLKKLLLYMEDYYKKNGVFI